MRRLLLVVLFGAAVGLWEAAVVPFLPPIAEARPLLPLIVLLLTASRRSRALAAAVAGGIMLDAYAVDAFSTTALRLVIVVLLLDLLARHFLTNRSLYATVTLALAARFLDAASAGLALLAGSLFVNVSPWHVPPPAVWIWDIVLSASGFLLIAAATRRYVTLERYGS